MTQRSTRVKKGEDITRFIRIEKTGGTDRSFLRVLANRPMMARTAEDGGLHVELLEHFPPHLNGVHVVIRDNRKGPKAAWRIPSIRIVNPPAPLPTTGYFIGRGDVIYTAKKEQ